MSRLQMLVTLEDFYLSLATQLTVSEEDAPKGIFGIFKKAKDHIKTLQIRYESAKENIDRVVATLENNQLTLIKNNKELRTDERR